MTNTTLDGFPATTWVKINGDGSEFDATVTKVDVRPSKSWDSKTNSYIDVPVKTKDGKDRDDIVLYGESANGDHLGFSFLAGSPAHRDLQAGSKKAGLVVSELEGRHVKITHAGRAGTKSNDAHVRTVTVK